MELNELNKRTLSPDSKEQMPVLFVGHGSPMNAIGDNEFVQGWEEAVKSIPKPTAILCVSAHWETSGTLVTAMEKPLTIHDFGGFPQELYEVQYPAPGNPELAKEVKSIVSKTEVGLDKKWGLDHGCWSVMRRMYPAADIPVIQLSLDYSKPAQYHYDLAVELLLLRKKGILIIGSGNIVHNLRVMVWEDTAFDWALDFDARARQWILDNDHEPLIHYEKQGNSAVLSINSAEHYLPLLYILGLKEKDEPVSFSNEKVWGGSLSMRCVRIG